MDGWIGRSAIALISAPSDPPPFGGPGNCDSSWQMGCLAGMAGVVTANYRKRLPLREGPWEISRRVTSSLGRRGMRSVEDLSRMFRYTWGCVRTHIPGRIYGSVLALCFVFSSCVSYVHCNLTGASSQGDEWLVQLNQSQAGFILFYA